MTLQQRVSKIEKALDGVKEMLSEIKKEEKEPIKRGDTVKVAGKEWLVLEIEDNKIHCLLKNFDKTMRFDSDSNNYAVSQIRKYLTDDFYKIIKNIGEDKIYPITTDLLSLDGQKEYDSLTGDKVSLLTVDQYRKNRDILPNMDKWWWLATPWSTECNDYTTSVCCVSGFGIVDYNYCISGCAVRPFCIFDSSIFES